MVNEKLIPHLSLSQAKALVAHLEAEQIQEANQIIESIDFSATSERILFDQIGELTRELHDALLSFQNDTRLVDLAGQELPDAQNRLSYVIEMTDKAACTTMDAVDHCIPIADKLIGDLESITPGWEGLMTRNLALGDFKALCHAVDDLLNHFKGSSADLREKLTDILMAQEFQDLTGQVINKVIALVQEIEAKLVDILTVCSKQAQLFPPKEEEQQVEEKKSTAAEGPIIDAESRTDVVHGQDEVDDLLSSLGF